MIIRRERPTDHDVVRALHLAAFAVDPAGGERRRPDDVVEPRLVDELRVDAGFLPHLSLIAVDEDVVVGHGIVTRARLEPAGTPVLGLGPLGVLPERHGEGIGTVLVHALLAVAEAAGEPLLGDPAYYRRFGFRPGAELGVAAPDPGWGRYFQARRLTDGPPVAGTFRYAEPFDRLQDFSAGAPGAG